MTTRVEQKMLSVNFAFVCGQVAKLANAPALGADGAILESSSLSLPTRKSNNSGKNKSVDTICFSKFVAVYVALRKKCCNVERVCIEGFNSEPLASLRIYPPNSYIPTTAYFPAIPA